MGIPLYLVPLQYRAAAQRTVDWLGFAARSVRLARLAGSGAMGVGLCEARFFEEDPDRALQLLGTTAVHVPPVASGTQGRWEWLGKSLC